MKYLDALPGGDHKIVHLWDIDKGEVISRFEGHAKWSIARPSHPMASTSSLPAGMARRALSSTFDGTVRLWGLPK